MKAFHLVGPAPFYTNSFLLISDAGNAVVIDPAAEVQEYIKANEVDFITFEAQGK